MGDRAPVSLRPTFDLGAVDITSRSSGYCKLRTHVRHGNGTWLNLERQRPRNSKLTAAAACEKRERRKQTNSLLRKTRVLQIRRETRKQPHECPERLRPGLYNDILLPQGALSLYIGIKMEKVCCVATSTDTRTWCLELTRSDVRPCAKRHGINM